MEKKRSWVIKKTEIILCPQENLPWNVKSITHTCTFKEATTDFSEHKFSWLWIITEHKDSWKSRQKLTYFPVTKL